MGASGEPCTCHKCREPKPYGLCLWAGDAGKFYETFTVSEGVSSCDEYLSQVQGEAGGSTVTVVTSRRVRGHIGGKAAPFPPPPRARLHVYTFRELLRFFHLGLTHCWVVIRYSVLGYRICR